MYRFVGYNTNDKRRTVVENISFLRPDYRGDIYRVRAQTCLYDAMEKRLNLNAAEKELIIRAVDCHPEDAHIFCKYQ